MYYEYHGAPPHVSRKIIDGLVVVVHNPDLRGLSIARSSTLVF